MRSSSAMNASMPNPTMKARHHDNRTAALTAPAPQPSHAREPPDCGSCAVVSSWSLLISQQSSCRFELLHHATPLFKFPEPPLRTGSRWPATITPPLVSHGPSRSPFHRRLAGNPQHNVSADFQRHDPRGHLGRLQGSRGVGGHRQFRCNRQQDKSRFESHPRAVTRLPADPPEEPEDLGARTAASPKAGAE